MSKVTLYDIPSKDKTPWSLNPWKTRMILNFKGIDYKTQWIEYPDLAPTFKSFGIPPNDKNAPGYFVDYTSPAIRYEDGTYGMDSWPIALELEKQYPTPSLHLDDPIVVKIRDAVKDFAGPLRTHFLPKVPSILGERSADYFNSTREKMFGMPLPQVEKELATEQGWIDAEKAVKEIGDLLRKNGGPYFLGDTVSYADFIFVSYLHFLKTIVKPSFERYLALDPALGKLYNASTQWLEKID